MIKVCFISPYPPRHDGISEFNQDLIKSLTLQNITNFGVAINENNNYCNNYDSSVQFQIRKYVKSDYINAAKFINKQKHKINCIQLEYSLFGGFDGAYIKSLIKNLYIKPFIVVHGLPINSYSRRKIVRKNFFQEIAPYTKGFIVINPLQKIILESWNIKSPIIHIWHGAPDEILNHQYLDSRKKLHINNELIILNFGLFHQKKGLEYLIDGFAQFCSKYPQTKLYLCGKMLSTEKNIDYLDNIKTMIESLRIKNKVMIIDKFFQKHELYQYLTASDIVVLPYIKRDLVSSGPLSFSVLANKYIITTPFPYAKALVSNKSVSFVHYENSNDIYNSLLKYVNNPKEINYKKNQLRTISKEIIWSKIGTKYAHLFMKYDKNII